MAKRWIRKGYNIDLLLSFVGLAPSTFYGNISRKEFMADLDNPGKASVGRPKTQFSHTLDDKKIADEQKNGSVSWFVVMVFLMATKSSPPL